MLYLHRCRNVSKSVCVGGVGGWGGGGGAEIKLFSEGISRAHYDYSQMRSAKIVQTAVTLLLGIPISILCT